MNTALERRLAESRGDRTAFFVFGRHGNDPDLPVVAATPTLVGHPLPGPSQEQPNDILLHVRMWDKDRVQQQEPSGSSESTSSTARSITACRRNRFIRSLADSLGVDRIEVDMLKFTGPAFAQVDNRTAVPAPRPNRR